MKMKMKLLSLAIVVFAAVISFAAFPVDKENKQIEQSTMVVENVDGVTSSLTISALDADLQNSNAEWSSPAKLDGGKSQLVALLLAIFVGYLGIHRFYLGYTGIGIIQLLTGGGCGIWALIDMIMIATGDLQPKNGKYTSTL